MVAILTDVGNSRSLNEDFASYIEKNDLKSRDFV